MRPSLSLAILGLVGNLAYGFSSSTNHPSSGAPRAFVTSIQQNTKKTTPTEIIPTAAMSSRGGAIKASQKSASTTPEPRTFASVLASLWGTGGVVYILVKAIRRVLPIAMEPFVGGEGVTPLTNFQLVAYVATCLWFAHVEGYKGFQTKFSPLVVSRSLTLRPSSTRRIHYYLLAPLYSMGLFHATTKRMKTSWGVTLGVTAIVAAVKKLPYPWRNIVDAGVVAGLTWGTISIVLNYIKAVVLNKPELNGIDPALPETDNNKKKKD